MQVGVEFTQVAAVGFNRIDGKTTLHSEMGQISLSQRIQHHLCDDSQMLG
jgi:hypothetical protein